MEKMLRYLNTRSLAIVFAAFLLASCDEEVTTPNSPTTEPKTETFTGTITPNGASTHDFSVATGGTVTATLKAIGTDNTLVVGFSLGNWNSTAGTCLVVLDNSAATGGAVLTGTMTNTGSLCVRVYDVGNVPAGARVEYSAEVVHP
jgi:hypothetical protein